MAEVFTHRTHSTLTGKNNNTVDVLIIKWPPLESIKVDVTRADYSRESAHTIDHVKKLLSVVGYAWYTLLMAMFLMLVVVGRKWTCI